MNKNVLLTALATLDLWIAATLITSLICNMLLKGNGVLMIVITIVCAIINAIFWSFIAFKVYSNFFSKKKEVKGIIRN